MTIAAIILLVVLGILLILLEFFVVPGITIAGIGGLAMMATGIYIAYDAYGNLVGNYILVGTLLFVIAVLIYALKSGTWNILMLKSSIKGTAKPKLTEEEGLVKVGDEGVCISRLAPMGKVMINNEFFEAESRNKLIDENSKIVVTKVSNRKLIVKLKNE
jgi:membrane-bound ClpP family serine protease